MRYMYHIRVRTHIHTLRASRCISLDGTAFDLVYTLPISSPMDITLLFAGSILLLLQQSRVERSLPKRDKSERSIRRFVAGNWRIRTGVLRWLFGATSLIFSRAETSGAAEVGQRGCAYICTPLVSLVYYAVFFLSLYTLYMICDSCDSNDIREVSTLKHATESASKR